MELSYKLQHFEGPLDLLLHLIEKNKVNIYDIPIAQITEQYLEYMSQMESEDLNVVSEFLVMAATLLDIKARMLLPAEVDEQTGEEVDPRAELVARLLEHKKYKLMARELADRQFDADRIFYKASTIPKAVSSYEQPVDLDELFGDMTLARLQKIFDQVMKRTQDRIDPERSKFGTIKKEPISLEQRIISIVEYAKQRGTFSFVELLSTGSTRTEVVVTFLSVLELMRLGAIVLEQEEIFGDINMTWTSQDDIDLSELEELE